MAQSVLLQAEGRESPLRMQPERGWFQPWGQPWLLLTLHLTPGCARLFHGCETGTGLRKRVAFAERAAWASAASEANWSEQGTAGTYQAVADADHGLCNL